MNPTSLDREIRDRIEAFLGELSQLVRASALEAVRSALGGEAGAATRRAAPARAAGGAPSRRGRRGKRSSDEVSALGSQVLSYIESHSGERLEQIGSGMGMPTKELKLPIQKLLADGAIRTEGQRRGTKYFAGGGASGRARGRRARKA